MIVKVISIALLFYIFFVMILGGLFLGMGVVGVSLLCALVLALGGNVIRIIAIVASIAMWHDPTNLVLLLTHLLFWQSVRSVKDMVL